MKVKISYKKFSVLTLAILLGCNISVAQQLYMQSSGDASPENSSQADVSQEDVDLDDSGTRLSADWCFYHAVNVNKKISPSWNAGFYLEHRANNNFTTTAEYFLRPMVTWIPISQISVTMQADLSWASSGFRIRFLPQFSTQQSFGDFNLSFRQRVQSTWTPGCSEVPTLLRSRLKLAYDIPSTPLAISVAAEPYYLKKVDKCRIYSGVRWKLSDTVKLNFMYVRQLQFSRKYDDNILWLILSINL